MDGEVLEVRRKRIDGVWCSVHTSADGLIEINSGPDDQRPAHDGCMFWQPICVAEHLPFGSPDDVWQYHFYCGHCHKRIGSLGEVREFCSRCGAGIAHYIFAMGVRHYRRPDTLGIHSMPDVLPSDLPEG